VPAGHCNWDLDYISLSTTPLASTGVTSFDGAFPKSTFKSEHPQAGRVEEAHRRQGQAPDQEQTGQPQPESACLLRGFTRRNLFRMRQFHETYRHEPKLAPLVRQLPWTHNLLILAGTRRPEQREFYLRLCAREKWPSRELERQLNGCLFERAVLCPPKVSAALTQLHPSAETAFKDSYLLEFLDLAQDHSEADLQAALVANLRRFLIELGRDFCFVDEQTPFRSGARIFVWTFFSSTGGSNAWLPSI
jgi:predicted nuclease of restriction endonuclease-like (RecB) superfamily